MPPRTSALLPSRTLLPAASTLLLLTACASSAPPTQATPSASTTAPTEDTARAYPSTQPAAPPRAGLDHPENDPEIVRRAKAALTCQGWKNVDQINDACLAVISAYADGPLKGNDATCMRLFQDPDPRVAILGAYGLRKTRAWTENTAMARIALDVLDRKNAAGALDLVEAAEAASLVDAAKTKLSERIKKTLAALSSVDAKVAFFDGTQWANGEAFLEMTMDLAKRAPEEPLRATAMSSSWIGTQTEKRAAVCALWLEGTKDPSELVATSAARSLAVRAVVETSDHCHEQVDQVVALVVEKAKGKTLAMPWAIPAFELAGGKALPAKHRATLTGIVKRIAAEKANVADVRLAALRALTKLDVNAAKALATTLAKDPDETVRRSAPLVIAQEAGAAVRPSSPPGPKK